MLDLFSVPPVMYCEPAGSFLIARPGYAISNLVYVLVGLYILFKFKRLQLAALFGGISMLIGLCSFMYDATYTLLSQLIDLTGMFIFVLVLLGLNIKRLSPVTSTKMLVGMGAFVIVFLILLTFIFGGSTGRILFGLVVLGVLETEIQIYRKPQLSYSLKNWGIALGLFAGGFALWLLDANQILCDPNNILNGRSLFHLLTAFTIYFLFRFYSDIQPQFRA